MVPHPHNPILVLITQRLMHPPSLSHQLAQDRLGPPKQQYEGGCLESRGLLQEFDKEIKLANNATP